MRKRTSFVNTVQHMLHKLSLYANSMPIYSIGKYRNRRMQIYFHVICSTCLPEGTTHAESESLTETTDCASPTGFVHPAGPSVGAFVR